MMANATSSQLMLINSLVAEKDRLVREKDELVVSKDRLWRELHQIACEKDIEIDRLRHEKYDLVAEKRKAEEQCKSLKEALIELLDREEVQAGRNEEDVDIDAEATGAVVYAVTPMSECADI